jgi:hypothetical protein
MKAAPEMVTSANRSAAFSRSGMALSDRRVSSIASYAQNICTHMSPAGSSLGWHMLAFETQRGCNLHVTSTTQDIEPSWHMRHQFRDTLDLRPHAQDVTLIPIARHYTVQYMFDCLL